MAFIHGVSEVAVSAVSGYAKVDVYSNFQRKISQLEVDLKKEKSVFKKYEIFLKSHKELSDLRSKNPRQKEFSEINMSLFMDSLAGLPAKKDFDEKKCSQYLKDAHLMMGSYDKEKKEPFVERALAIIDLICKD